MNENLKRDLENLITKYPDIPDFFYTLLNLKRSLNIDISVIIDSLNEASKKVLDSCPEDMPSQKEFWQITSDKLEKLNTEIKAVAKEHNRE